MRGGQARRADCCLLTIRGQVTVSEKRGRGNVVPPWFRKHVDNDASLPKWLRGTLSRRTWTVVEAATKPECSRA